MLKKFYKKDQGFTLIEIILVLAIAGLILLLVFVALSGAQRTRRDTARKSDAARMLAAIESCAGNHNGVYLSCFGADPLITASVGTPYFSGNTPIGGPYGIGPTAAVDTFEVGGGSCLGAPAGAAAHVSVGVESGQPYCVDNH